MRLLRLCFALALGSTAIVALVAAQVALLRAIRGARRDRPPVVIVVSPAAAPAIPPSPPPPRLPPPAAGPPAPAAPADPDTVPRPVAGAAVPFATTPWIGVAVSPDRADVVAAWNEKEVRVSGDGGDTFQAALPFGARAVAVGSDGTIYAWTVDCRLAVVDRKRRARLIEGPGCEPQLLAARGKWLVAVATTYPDRTTVQVSSDHGETWDAVDLPCESDDDESRYPFVINDVALGADGNIELTGQHLQGGECGASYDFRWRIQGGKAEVRAPWPSHIYDAPMFLGVDGWTYTTCSSDADGAAACAVDGKGELRVLGQLELAADSRIVRARRAAYLLAGERIYRAAGTDVTPVASDVPAGFTAETIDSGDRVYGILAGSIVSWSAGGWRMHLGYAGDPAASQEYEDEDERP